MTRKRAHIILPEELLSEIDRLVGERGRSAFLAEVVQRKIQRRKLFAALREAKGCWKTADHPELEDGPEAFVDRLRQENDERVRVLLDAGCPRRSLVAMSHPRITAQTLQHLPFYHSRRDVYP
jgi:hypothetical protein